MSMPPFPRPARRFPPGPTARQKCVPTCSIKSARLILSGAKQLGPLLSREEGKTLPEGIGEVVRAGRICKYFAGEALRRHGQTLESTRPGIDARPIARQSECLG